uniref:hypothetical protein n=1 Tax=Ectopseudomonas guguanensis TaxID=1198456 RepID=UPI0028A8D042
RDSTVPERSGVALSFRRRHVYDDSFVVKYSFPGFFGASLPSDIVLGTKAEDGATELRLVSQEKWQTPISKKFLNRLQSGACE